MPLDRFRAVWCIDFEYHQPDGHSPVPLCLVAHEMRTGRRVRQWLGDAPDHPSPFETDDGTLMVAYYASAEMACCLQLGWPLPRHVLDLYAEFRLRTNGLPRSCGDGLLGACAWFGLPTIGSDDKDGMRSLAVRGGPYTDREREDLVAYCDTDVTTTVRLLDRMAPGLDLDRALIRGRYSKAVARMERTGVPIDTATWQQVVTEWPAIERALIERIDRRFDVYDGTAFRAGRWAAWCERQGIPWPRQASGALALDRDTFRDMAKAYPIVEPMHQLRATLGSLRLRDLAIGPDGRNRVMLSPFRSKTGRNAPSTSRFVFGPAAWIRSLIRPGRGRGLAYVDWSQQEFGIAAVLSGDANMRRAYESSDPYLAFAHMAGAVPADATRRTHPVAREQFKVCALGVLYGMGAPAMARQAGCSEAEARYLLQQHKAVFRRFWRWSRAAVDTADLTRRIQSVFGWTLHISDSVKPTTVANFPMQANGAEMLRLACIRATEAGVRVCAPVHDALLIEAELAGLAAAVEQTRQAMAWASRQVLDGFELRTDAVLVRYPDRYVDGRGVELWETMAGMLPGRPTPSRASA